MRNTASAALCLRLVAFAVMILFASALHADEPTPADSVEQRIAARDFPSIFQAWNPANNLNDEDKWTSLARHDLVFHAPDFFGLKWTGEFKGLAATFDAKSLESAEQKRQMLLRKNPNLVILAELRYRDAHRSYLPADHAWWKRKDGEPIIGWEEGGYYLLDIASPGYQAHVAKQAGAIMQSGMFDGIMLDWWLDDDDRLALVRAIRKIIGDDALILVNANDRKTPKTAGYVNGYFMECYKSKTAEDWDQIAQTLQWAEANLKEPRINCLETWFHKSREDAHLMRATTTLSLTLSDGYCLFADPNPLPTPDHLHDWYAFWDQSLGRPKAKGVKQADDSIHRKFDHGLAVYNPMGNKPAAVNFKTPHTAASSSKTAKVFVVPPGDGDLFIQEAAD